MTGCGEDCGCGSQEQTYHKSVYERMKERETWSLAFQYNGLKPDTFKKTVYFMLSKNRRTTYSVARRILIERKVINEDGKYLGEDIGALVQAHFSQSTQIPSPEKTHKTEEV